MNPPATGANLILSWQSVAGKSYAIEPATNLVTGFNEVAVEHILPTPTVNTQDVPLDQAKSRFYRVVIEP